MRGFVPERVQQWRGVFIRWQVRVRVPADDDAVGRVCGGHEARRASRVRVRRRGWCERFGMRVLLSGPGVGCREGVEERFSSASGADCQQRL